MLKKLLLAAALALPSVGHAQVEFSFANFVTTQNGFTTTLLFRDGNKFTDPTIVALGKSFQVSTSESVHAFCQQMYTCELFGGQRSYFVGNVQHADFSAGTGTYRAQVDGYYDAGSCFLPYGDTCVTKAFDAMYSVYGCQAPAISGIAEYQARTCAASGYDGWLALDLHFAYFAQPFAAPVSVPTFSALDLKATFNPVTLAGVNALVAPEPTTWALCGLGLLAIAAARRRHA